MIKKIFKIILHIENILMLYLWKREREKYWLIINYFNFNVRDICET